MNTLEIEQAAEKLTDDEKLQLIDKLERSLTTKQSDPPEWHGDVLAERLKKIESGEAKFLSHEEITERMSLRQGHEA